MGRASLRVQSGELHACGATITPASGAVQLCCDERCGGALLLEPGAAAGTVPLAASGAIVFRLAPQAGGAAAAGAGPLPQPAADGADAGGGRRQLGFQAWLASDPAAPPLPLPPRPLRGGGGAAASIPRSLW